MDNLGKCNMRTWKTFVNYIISCSVINIHIYQLRQVVNCVAQISFSGGGGLIIIHWQKCVKISHCNNEFDCPFRFVNFCFAYFEAIFLAAYRFKIVVSSCWISTFILYLKSSSYKKNTVIFYSNLYSIYLPYLVYLHSI